MKKIGYIVLGLFLMVSCNQKEELLDQPEESADLQLINVNMKENYEDQIWFSLETAEEVKRNKKTDWDLMFSCKEDKMIYLNSSVVMKVAITNENNWKSITNDDGLAYEFDHASGFIDSLAIGNVENHLNKIMVIDRGLDLMGKSRGKYKFQILGVNNDQYSIKVGELESQDGIRYEVIKNKDYPTVAFNLELGTTELIEPMKQNYDIVFTQFTHSFYNPYEVYLVTGVLNNKYQTKVVEITNRSFSEIGLNQVGNLNFTDSLNAIGFDWKTYSFETTSFTIHQEKIFVIKTQKNNYYKLQFLDFYNSQGIKGNPQFNLQKIIE